jgi:hypothetical protein
MLVGDDMDNCMANRMDDVDILHIEIDNLNDPLVGFCFIKDIDIESASYISLEITLLVGKYPWLLPLLHYLHRHSQ